jgi:hypothetical protein
MTYICPLRLEIRFLRKAIGRYQVFRSFFDTGSGAPRYLSDRRPNIGLLVSSINGRPGGVPPSRVPYVNSLMSCCLQHSIIAFSGLEGKVISQCQKQPQYLLSISE